LTAQSENNVLACLKICCIKRIRKSKIGHRFVSKCIASGFLPASTLLLSVLPALSDTLYTTSVGGNSQDGNIFNISATKSLIITGFYQNFAGQANGALRNYSAYYRLGSSTGTTPTTTGWILLGSANNFSAGPQGTYTLVPFSSTIQLSVTQGTTIGLYLTNTDNTSNSYTNGTSVGSPYASDSYLTIYEGYGTNQASGAVFAPRIWNGGIIYTAEGITTDSPANASSPHSTNFAGGTLIVNASGSYSTAYNAGTGGSINQNGKVATFSGVFSGSGALNFINTGAGGTITLTGSNTYTGTTTVSSGTSLLVNGSIAQSSGLLVNSGATISGTGSLPATTIASGGTIAPGNSIGLTTAASLNFSGILDAEIQGPQNDKVSVTGNVTNFTGTANLIPFGGGSPWPNFNYQLITASNNFATSSSLTLIQSSVTSALLNNGTNLVQEADGNATTFDVQWQPKNGSGATASALSSLGKGQRNQLATAGAFDSVFSSLATAAGNQAGTTTGLNATGTAIGTTGFTTGQAAAAGISSDFLTATSQLLALTSGSQLTAAIDSLSPEPYAAYQAVGLSTLKRQRDLLFSQAGNCQGNGWIINAPETKKGKTPKRPVCVFAQANNATSSIRGQDGLSSYNSGVFSSFYGLEYQPSKQWSVGAAYGYGTSNLSNMSLTSANVSSDVNGGALYAVYKPAERWNIKALLGYSNFDVDGSRNVAQIGNGSTIKGNTSANGYTAAINASYDIPIKAGKAKLPILLKPFAGLAWGSYEQKGFTESDGGALNLRVDGNTANSLVGTLGVEFSSSPIPLFPNKVQSITPRLTVAYQVDALANSSDNKALTSSFVDAPGAGSFTTQGENGGANALIIEGGFDMQVAKNTSLYVTANYNSESNGSQFGYGGGIRVKF
jgi:uncharacterized protein with beta-barrel porin domain